MRIDGKVIEYYSQKVVDQLVNTAFEFGQEKKNRVLSKREKEVLTEIMKGRSNKLIAIELGLNEKTISTYKARLMKKLKVNNIVDLIKSDLAKSIINEI